MFTEICRKVYFAIEDYIETDLIIANAYLAHVFTEFVAVTGQHAEYREYAALCHKNLEAALLRLPLLLPATMEAVAALTLGVRLTTRHSQNGLTYEVCRLSMLLKIRRLQRLGRTYQQRLIDAKPSITTVVHWQRQTNRFELPKNGSFGPYIG